MAFFFFWSIFAKGHSILKVIMQEVERSIGAPKFKYLTLTLEVVALLWGNPEKKTECRICQAKNNYCLPSQQGSHSSWIPLFQMSNWRLHYLCRSQGLRQLWIGPFVCSWLCWHPATPDRPPSWPLCLFAPDAQGSSPQAPQISSLLGSFPIFPFHQSGGFYFKAAGSDLGIPTPSSDLNSAGHTTPKPFH